MVELILKMAVATGSCVLRMTSSVLFETQIYIVADGLVILCSNVHRPYTAIIPGM